MKESRKTILITGASSGIGRESARLFQAQGWNVVASMRSPQQETELNGLDNVICPRLDVTDEDSIRSAIAEAIETFGAIDVVLNNAGYGLIGAFETFDHEQVARQFQTNVLGLMAVTREVLPHMRERQQGMLINVASFAGRSIFPMYSVYHASKFAVEGFSESLQYEVSRHGIQVKIIEPGTVKTEFWGRSTDRENMSGITAYDDYGQPVLDVIDKGAALLGASVEDVAGAIWTAAHDSSPRLRYVVGLDAKLTLSARRLLPDSGYRRMMNLMFSPIAQPLYQRIIGRLG